MIEDVHYGHVIYLICRMSHINENSRTRYHSQSFHVIYMICRMSHIHENSRTRYHSRSFQVIYMICRMSHIHENSRTRYHYRSFHVIWFPGNRSWWLSQFIHQSCDTAANINKLAVSQRKERLIIMIIIAINIESVRSLLRWFHTGKYHCPEHKKGYYMHSWANDRWKLNTYHHQYGMWNNTKCIFWHRYIFLE